MRIQLLILGAVVWAALRKSNASTLDDVLIRSYAKDWLADPGVSQAEKALFNRSASAASAYNVPIAWVLAVAKMGTPLERLDRAALQMRRLLEETPLPALDPASLLAFKNFVIDKISSEVR